MQQSLACQAEGLPIKDMKIHAAGDVSNFNRRLKVSSEMSISPDDSNCFIKIIGIEKQ